MLIKPSIPTEELLNHDEILPKAYSYVRFSSKRQGAGDSFRRQTELAIAYAAENNLLLQDTTYEDLGVSAFDGSNLKKGALAAFVEACENGLIERGSFLLVEHLDRISRDNISVPVPLVFSLVGYGIRIVSLTSGQILDEATVNQPHTVMQMLSTFVNANEESEKKSRRVKQAHQQKRDSKNPFAFGQGPSWLTPNETRTGWVVKPEEAASVVKVFELAAKGLGCTNIAKLANQEKWPVPGRADSWHPTLPHKLLHNRRVLGEFEPSITNPQKSGEGNPNWKPRIKTGECWTDYYPQIVSVELFNAAQSATVLRRTYKLPGRRDNGYHNVFQGLMKCGHCGATLARKAASSTRNSPGYALYVCADTNRGKSNCPSWNARELHSTLIPRVIQCVSDELLKGDAQKDAVQKLDQERADYHRELQGVKNLIELAEQLGGSSQIAERILILEKSVALRKMNIVTFVAEVEACEIEIKEEDVEEAIDDALAAVLDITNDSMIERSLLHKSFFKSIETIMVWPKKYAVIKLRSQKQANIVIPFCVESLDVMACNHFETAPFVGPIKPEEDEVIDAFQFDGPPHLTASLK